MNILLYSCVWVLGCILSYLLRSGYQVNLFLFPRFY